tara:strand:+ start:622 stop:792 length:171 start_codon:yes stop_codon:yes gene_type:complete
MSDDDNKKLLSKQYLNKLVKDGTPGAVDTKNPQRRQVIATAGKIRIQVDKGNLTNG